MKMNLPVTGRENVITPGRALVSRTDTKGVITFANDAFVEVSGFTRAELVGSSHNIVRHPDIPPAVFADMWDTLHQGLPWRGVVKNRCKNGDHYWVDARVVPVRKNGATIGYMSVRGVPSREAIAQAEAAYAAIAASGAVSRAGRSSGWKRLISIRNGVLAGIVFVSLMMIAGGILGIGGLNLSSSAINTLYQEELEPVQAIGRINFLMADNRAQLALALRDSAAGADSEIPEHMQLLMKNRAEIETLWRAYSALPQSGEQRALSDQYWQARTGYVERGLLQTKAALERGDTAAAERLLQGTVNPTYTDANAKVERLLAFLSQKARNNALKVAERNRTISIVAMIGITLGSMAFMLAGLLFFRTAVVPLQSSVNALEQITEGNLSGDTDTSGYGEPGRVAAAVEVMQMHLKVMMDEIRISAGEIRDQCKRLNLTMMNLTEHADEQHDRIYQALGNIAESSTGLDRLAADAENLMLATEQIAGKQLADPQPATPVDAVIMEEIHSPPDDGSHMLELIHELAGASRVEAFTMQDTVAQMNQISSLIVDSRGEVQGAWAATQRLEQAADELDRLVRYFD